MNRRNLFLLGLLAASLLFAAGCDDDGGGGGGDVTDATDATSTPDTTPDSTSAPDTTDPDTTDPDTTDPDTTDPDTTDPDTTDPDTTDPDTTDPDTTDPDTTDPDTTDPDTTDPDTTDPDTTDPDTTDPDTVEPVCDNNGYTAAENEFAANTSVARYIGLSSSSDPTDILVVEFWDIGAGIPTGPATYQIGVDPADQNYETCETCILIYQDCSGDSCQKIFFATGGTLEVTEWNPTAGTIVGTLTNAALVEVTIDQNTAASTPVPGGEDWCISSFTLDTSPECVVDADCAGNPNGEVCRLGECTEAATCDQTGFTSTSETVNFVPGASIRYEGLSSTATPNDRLRIEFWDDGSGLPPGPGTYAIGARPEDQNYATCETCVLIYEGCDAAGNCQKIFFASSGSITITALDEATSTFVGTLDNAELIEVTMSGATSTPVPGGETWCISSYAFDATPECVVDADCAGNPNGEVCRLGACTTGTCDRTGFTAEVEESDIDFDFGYVGYFGTSSVTTPNDILIIEFYDIGAGVPTTPGTYPIGATPDDQNYATCETCVLIYADCDDDFNCSKYFFATGGEIVITALDEATQTITGTLENAELVEVTIGSGAVSTPVPGGESWCIPSFGFSAP